MDYLKYRNKGKFLSDKRIKYLKSLETTKETSLVFALLLIIAATSIATL